MKKFLTLFAALLAFVVSASSMPVQPVSWNVSVEKVKSNVYEVRILPSFKEDGWHTYDLGPYDGGPIPTSISVTGNVALKGEPYVTEVETYYDDIFEMNIGVCGEGSAFIQKVEAVSDQPVEIQINIEWQACNDMMCFPPEECVLTATVPAKTAGILGGKVFRGIMIVILLLIGLFLLGAIKFKNTPKFEHLTVLRLLLVIIVLSAMVWLIPGLWADML